MPAKKTTGQFIADAKGVHGLKWDYSLTKYMGALKNLTIICPVHGPFEQTPSVHLSGSGCKQCSVDRRTMTTEQFVAKASMVNRNYYSYAKAKYINSHSKVTIICPIHGEFEQKPNNHLQGQGCNECGNIRGSKLQTMSRDEFISAARSIHGDKWDYEQVEYVTAQIKVKINCDKHGVFEQTPNSHLSKKTGCPQCGYELGSAKQTKSTGQFILEAKNVHGDGTYNYGLVDYKGAWKTVKILCHKHGVFNQKPSHHLSGKGCNECGIEKNAERFLKTTEDFIAEAQLVHGDKWDYSQTHYTGAQEQLKIICPDHGPYMQIAINHLNGKGCLRCVGRLKTTEEFIAAAREIHGDDWDYSETVYKDSKTQLKISCPEHGVFKKLPANHLKGQGCQGCAKYGFQPNKSGILYYLKIESLVAVAYKVGITNLSVEERFHKRDLDKITVLRTTIFENGADAYAKEQSILRRFKNDKYLGEDLLESGNSELFDKDVLQLDTIEV